MRAVRAATTSAGSLPSATCARSTMAAYSVRGDGPDAGRRAPAEVGQDAGGGLRPARQRLGARAQREGLREGLRGRLGGAPARERPDVARTALDVVTDLAHHAHPWEPLDGELEPDGVLRPCRAPVVPRGTGGDRAQLAHLGLQRRGARHGDDLGRQADHLGHPAALLGGREVAQDPPADRAGGAHVERRPLRVLEDVDPRAVGQSVGQAALAPPRVGNAIAVPLQLGEGVHPEVADPLHQPVQDVHGRLRIGQGAVVGGHLRSGSAGRACRACSWGPRRGSGRGAPAARCPPPEDRARSCPGVRRRP